MKTENATSQSYVAQPSRYTWVAVATLVIALLVWAFVAIPRVAAANPEPYTDVSAFYAERMRAQAEGVAALSNTDVSAFYAERMRAQASQGIASIANPEQYTDVSKFYAERMRAQASQGTQPYTDVSKFYAERMRAQASQGGDLAANPELMLARRAYGAPASIIAANPELVFARRYIAQSASAADPGPTFASGSYDQGYVSCSANGNELAGNPELGLFHRVLGC